MDFSFGINQTNNQLTKLKDLNFFNVDFSSTIEESNEGAVMDIPTLEYISFD